MSLTVNFQEYIVQHGDLRITVIPKDAVERIVAEGDRILKEHTAEAERLTAAVAERNDIIRRQADKIDRLNDELKWPGSLEAQTCRDRDNWRETAQTFGKALQDRNKEAQELRLTVERLKVELAKAKAEASSANALREENTRAAARLCYQHGEETKRLKAIALDMLDRWGDEKMARLTSLRFGVGAYEKQANFRAECEQLRREIRKEPDAGSYSGDASSE